ncbi:MAG: hypothetical protein ACXAB7_25215, partial [Candidatus Kariarchaeaceae archaeon]
MHGLDKDDYDREYGDWILLKRILSYFKPYRKHMGIISLTISATAIAATLVPLFLAEALDGLKEGVDYSEVRNLILLVLTFSAVNFGFNALSQEITARAVQGAVYDLREDAF